MGFFEKLKQLFRKSAPQEAPKTEEIRPSSARPKKACKKCGKMFSYDPGWDFIPNYCKDCKKQFALENPEAVKVFLQEYAASTAYTNESPAEAAQLIEKYGIVKAAVAEKAIPFCNIVCVTGTDMKQMVSGYFEVLFAQNPKAVGGELPEDDLFLIHE